MLGDDPSIARRDRDRARSRLPPPGRQIHAAPAGGEPAPLIRIAVLGLADRSLDARWTRLAQGLADDLAAELSRYSDLAVIGRASQPTPDAEPDVRRTAARLAARYLVTGKAEVLSERLRVLVTLIEGATGRVRWTRRIERPIAELPAVSEQVAAAIAASLGGILGEIHRVEREIVRRKPVASLDAYEHYLLGCDSCHENDRASTFKAIEHLKAAVAQILASRGRFWCSPTLTGRSRRAYELRPEGFRSSSANTP